MHRIKFVSRIAEWSATHRKLAIWGWLAFVVLAVAIGGSLGTKTLSNADQYTGESARAERVLAKADLVPNSEIVLIQSETSSFSDPEFQSVVAEVTQGLKSTDNVVNIASPTSGGGAVSQDGHSALVEFEIPGDEEEAVGNVDSSLETVSGVSQANPDFRVEQFGGASASSAVEEVFAGDLRQAETLSLPITLIILVIAFGSLVAAGIPLLLAISAVAATIGLVAIPSQILPVSDSLASVVLLIGLAVGVDYSLFYLRREREERARGKSERDSLSIAAATSGGAILISGVTVIVAMAGLLITGDSTFVSFAIGTMIVVGVAMFASLTVLPALLAWLGDRVEKGRIPFTKGMRKPAGESKFWSGVVTRVMKRPVVSTVVAGGLLLALAVPGLGLNTVVGGVDDLPADLPVVQTYERIQDSFPSEGVQAAVVVEATDVRGGEVAAGINRLVRDADASEAMIPGASVTYNKAGNVAQISIPTPGSGSDDASMAAMEEIRHELAPATVGQVEGATVSVTGPAAQSKDYSDLLSERMPLVFVFVLGLAFLLLLFTFRSIVIPLKAIALNLLSVGAAYGILVLIFQNGWGESLLGFESNGGITSWLPLFLFVILFGLSMDYHVFILTRIREAYDGGMSSDDSVRHGIASSAGTVTSAAIVMVAVFSIFATLSFVEMKQMGIGLAFAVLIDATIIRGVLLPATMKLLGDWNWYLPAWLERIMPGGPETKTVKRPEPSTGEAATPVES
jgi:uncharacterized membrane protein YdfJ with MMPL/SSD domain